jgi:hypothetical protein
MAIEVYQTSLPSFLAPSTKAECCVDWAWSGDTMRRPQIKLRTGIIDKEGLIYSRCAAVPSSAFKV